MKAGSALFYHQFLSSQFLILTGRLGAVLIWQTNKKKTTITNQTKRGRGNYHKATYNRKWIDMYRSCSSLGCHLFVFQISVPSASHFLTEHFLILTIHLHFACTSLPVCCHTCGGWGQCIVKVDQSLLVSRFFLFFSSHTTSLVEQKCQLKLG